MNARTGLLDGLLAALAVIAAVLLADRTRFVDPDLFMNFLCARDVLDLGAVPTVDTHSFARPDLAWTVNEWLGQLFQLAVFRVGGGVGLLAQRLALAALAASLLLLTARRSRASWPAAALALLVCWPAVAHFFLIRVRTLSFVALPLLLWLLTEHRRGSRWAVWLIPPLMALWVNLHGAYFLGLGLIGLAVADALAGRLLRRDGGRGSATVLAVVFGLAAAATLLHPAGLRVHGLVLGTIGGGNISTISEWLPVWDHPLAVTWTYGALIPLALGLAIWRLWRRDLLWSGALAGLALETALHVRFGALLGLVTAVPLAMALQRGVVKVGERGALGVRALALAALLTVPASWPVWGSPDLELRMDPRWTPLAAVRFMAANDLAGDVLAEYDWGAYVIWELPAARVFIDSRSDLLYPEEVEREWSTFALLDDGWEEVLTGSGATAVLLRATRLPEASVGALPGWRGVYSDGFATLLLREAPVNREFLERLEQRRIVVPPPVTDRDLVLD
jgi:hypothetical protein